MSHSRPEDEVDMIRHQTYRDDRYLDAQLSANDQLDERQVIFSDVKNVAATIGAVEHVVVLTGNRIRGGRGM